MNLITFSIIENNQLQQLLDGIQLFVILLFSLSFHEAAHAFMAYKCGDDTARLLGRMTLNPVPHIDPIGTLLMPAIMIISSMTGAGIRFLIGWAKPVPVNPLNFRNYRKGEFFVSFAGPFSNLILVAGGALICRALLMAYGFEIIHSNANIFFNFFLMFTSLNLILFTFNLIPIHPLDGSHILKLFLSNKASEAYDRVIAPYGFFIIIGLVYLGVFRFIYEWVSIPVGWLISAGL